MKKTISTIFAVISLQLLTAKAQTVSTFENLILPDTNLYWNGSGEPLGTTFSSGNAIFQNYYDTSWGGFWANGWAYSNMQDSTTADFTNLYSAVTAIGNSNSQQYAIGQQGAIINLNSNVMGKVVNGFYVTNATYAALSMRDGDWYAKKFGGTTGDDPDWFKLTIRNWYNGTLTDDSVEFYLADYRFSDNSQDYILKNWQWVDLAAMGNTDSLQFVLSSSDNSQSGMNTPAFFCIDDFTTSDNFLLAENISENIFSPEIFPNPNDGNFTVRLPDTECNIPSIIIYNTTGKIVYDSNLICTEQRTFISSQTLTSTSTSISTHLSKGIYFLELRINSVVSIKKIIIK